MIYLFSRILLWLFAAALLGGIVGWLLRGISWKTRLAELESTWRHRLDTSEKENANLAAERDRLIADTSLGKSSHSATLSRLDELEAELEAARASHSGCDEERERLQRSLEDLETEVQAGKASKEALGKDLKESKRRSTKLQKKLSRLEKGLTGSPSALETKSQRGTAERRLKGDPVAEPKLPAAIKTADQPSWLLSQPAGEKDDLKKIKGVGPVLEQTLNDLGIFHLRQIAGLSEQDIEWVAGNINTFANRIVRDNWVAQAAELEKAKHKKNA